MSQTNFSFGDKESCEALMVTIPQSLNPQYGMYIWPSAPVLAQFIWHNREFIKGKSVLEIGAGTALPGIVAAKLGADVTLSDGEHLPECMKNCRRACEVNNCNNVNVIGITWGDFNYDILKLPKIDVILGSDCFYDAKDFEDVIVTVSYLLDKYPGSQFWTAYQVRSSNRSIKHLLEKWNRKAKHVPLSEFGADTCCLAESALPGSHTVELYIIT